ncbi:MAG: ABC transporter ATP-binding protein [Rhodospirillales bacterium]|tara:strand:- start:4346 stop:5197 length:852 start_codon:yes stop_codon:yes gene_type:complete
MDIGKIHLPETENLQSNSAGEINVENVSIVFGEGESAFLAVDRVSAHILSGEFVCILGPSGCGKSTLLNAIAGLEEPSSGQVVVEDQVVIGPSGNRGMVFQQPALFPWKTVIENIAYGPRMAGKNDEEAKETANFLLDMIGLTAFADRRPQTLSGGMQQRVAIARALANSPTILLMDEPFGALDAQTRTMMQESLLQIWHEVGLTIVFVTHDIDEAIYLSDRILVMSAGPGRIVEEIDVDIFRPRTPETALEPRFIEVKRQSLEIIREQSTLAFEQQLKLGNL